MKITSKNLDVIFRSLHIRRTILSVTYIILYQLQKTSIYIEKMCYIYAIISEKGGFIHEISKW